MKLGIGGISSRGKTSRRKKTKKMKVTAAQKSARRKNIAVARKSRKKGPSKFSPKHLTSTKATMGDFLGAIEKFSGSKKGMRSLARSADRSYLRGSEKSHVQSMIYRISSSL